MDKEGEFMTTCLLCTDIFKEPERKEAINKVENHVLDEHHDDENMELEGSYEWLSETWDHI